MVMARCGVPRRTVFGVLLAAALLGGALPGAPAARAETSQAELIRSLIPTVVNITARAEVGVAAEPPQAGGQPSLSSQIQVNAGSGFIVDPAGLIVTNWHVVAGAFEIVVNFSDGSYSTAEVANAARVVDLALLKVNTRQPLPAVRWGDSSAVQVGDPVLAIGNALGVGTSVSGGIVSALNRNIGDTPVDDFIQTDAAINHGNSGGPLFDAKGDVIGVNSAIISPTAANAGIGFAMPSNDVQFVLQRLMHEEHYARPGWLGVKIQPVTLEMADALGLAEPHGSIVAWVLDGGPAARAGVLAGDIILRFNGQVPADERALLRAVVALRPGTGVTLGLWRNGREFDLPMTVDGWPEMVWERNIAPPRPNPHLLIPRDLGLTGEALTDAERARNAIAPDVKGVLLTAVAPGSEAARRGLERGDVVTQVGETPVQTPDELQQAIDRARGEGRHFALLLLLAKRQPTLETQFPGPNWITLRLAGG
jgi:serine protease Do